jgi:hypothetical protein
MLSRVIRSIGEIIANFFPVIKKYNRRLFQKKVYHNLNYKKSVYTKIFINYFFFIILNAIYKFKKIIIILYIYIYKSIVVGI